MAVAGEDKDEGAGDGVVQAEAGSTLGPSTPGPGPKSVPFPKDPTGQPTPTKAEE